MKQETELIPEFIELAPPELKNGIIYISMIYGSAIHKCCCGCGEKVVTPFSPTDWKLIFDGVSISLEPSIGNWAFHCKSHYWIRRNKVIWAPPWSQNQIDAGRVHDRFMKKRYFETADTATDIMTKEDSGRSGSGKPEQGLWRKLKGWWLHRLGRAK